MSPWEVIQTTASALGREYLELTMTGTLTHYPEGAGSTPNHQWIHYHPTKGVRITPTIADRTAPYTTWHELTRALQERINPDPLRSAWEVYQAAWAAWAQANDEWVRRYQRESIPDDLQDRCATTHTAQYRACHHAVSLLRTQIAHPEPADLFDHLETA